jgi:hypothetical protein
MILIDKNVTFTFLGTNSFFGGDEVFLRKM